MITLLQEPLAETAGNERMTVTIQAVDKVLTGHANHAALPALQLRVVNKSPVLHSTPRHSTSVLTENLEDGKGHEQSPPAHTQNWTCCNHDLDLACSSFVLVLIVVVAIIPSINTFSA